MHIPRSIIDVLQHSAKKRQINVNRHDLLTAIIFQAAMNTFPGGTRGKDVQFGLNVNVNDSLERGADLHNAWYPVTIPRPNQQTEGSLEDKLVELAAHIRQVAQAAQTVVCMQAFLQYYEVLDRSGPIYPRSLNPHKANIIVSCCSHLPAYCTSFPTVNGRKAFPCFFQGGAELSDLFTFFGLSYNDLVATWADRDRGFYFYGSLHHELWTELEQLRACLSPFAYSFTNGSVELGL
ncbi:hypothetical protein EYZ11_005477 [Aspergillus tanneri]|nr:hypothetical protein EYZ11_005477 [Aspergillus tanneri]